MKQRREINVFNIEAKMYKHMESLVNRVEELRIDCRKARKKGV